MPLDVKVKIDLSKPVGKLAFGYPLILSIGKTGSAYTEVSDLDDITAAKYTTDSNVYKAAELMFKQKNRPAKIAVCTLTAATDISTILNKGFRQIVLVDAETDTDIVTAVEATADKLYFPVVESASGLSAYKDKKRVVGFVHSNELASAALVGESAGREVGSFTYKNLILEGIIPMEITDTDLEAIHTANGLTFVTKAGDNVTTEGKAMAGEYIDILDSQDYIIQQLEYETQKVLNNTGKVPYDNNGIALLESVAVNVLKGAYNNGMIATNEDGTPAYSVDYAMRSETTPEDRVARKYLGGKFSFTLAGAIHNVEITGEITF